MAQSNDISVGVNAWVWTSPFTGESVEYLRKAASMGFDAFTIPVEEPDLIDIEAIKSTNQETQLQLFVSGAYGPTRDLTHEQARYRKESLEYIHSVLKICEQLGVTTLVGPAYSAVGKRRKIPDAQRRQEWQLAVKGLKEAGAMASDYGVTLAIEPLNRFETDLINTTAQVKKLIQEIDLPSVKIHLDTFHTNIEETDLYQAIITAGEDLVYVDASESHRGTPGKGLVAWESVKRGLADINYQGACVIESFTPACEAIADAAAIWRPLAESQDALAQDGLNFLKQLFK